MSVRLDTIESVPELSQEPGPGDISGGRVPLTFRRLHLEERSDQRFRWGRASERVEGGPQPGIGLAGSRRVDSRVERPMSHPVKPTRPPRAAFDSNFAKEESHVRSRGRDHLRHDEAKATFVDPPASAAPSAGAAAGPRERETLRPPQREALPPPQRETVSERTNRIEQKMTRATLVLERLPPMDGRARLLGSAILRRDEVLLDAVLAEMTDELIALSSGKPSTRRR